MNKRLMRAALLACAGLGTLGVADANAKAKYVYSGQKYTYMYPSNGCLTLNMRLTMSIVFPAKLAANLNNTQVTAVSWTVNDGLHKFKDTEKKAIAPLRAVFSTDAAGHITAWSIDSYYYASNGIDLLYTTHSKNSGDYSDDNNCTPSSSIGSNFVPGTWKPN